MFSGIVETQARVLTARTDRGLVFIEVGRPTEFDDVQIGDSICTNGVCLTIESFDDKKMTFALAAETLKVTGWTADLLRGSLVNLERSLGFGARVHGHMVSGHVDGVGRVVNFQDLGGSVQLDIEAPKALLKYVWQKGGWAINGVSLTVNSVARPSKDSARPAGNFGVVGHCLIPETLRRTNLGQLKVGDPVNLEVDMTARGLVQFLEAGIESGALAELFNQERK